jgi:ribonuclease-3
VPNLTSFQARLGYSFQDAALLQLALTHPSVAHEVDGPKQHNQRLEFLGDAVLQIVLSRELYLQFPHFDEGPLTQARAKLVNRHALAVHGRALGLGEELVLSRGEEINGGRTRGSALADAFEAVVGALFMDGGFDIARAFILRQFSANLGGLEAEPVIDNPKGELQELLQAASPHAPEYRVVSATGPDHNRVFECVVLHQGIELARGTGQNKRAAESYAALHALAALRSPGAPETVVPPPTPLP